MNLHFIFKDYITHQHPMPNDYQGKVVTTIIESRENQKSNKASVLYIHGFNDYFFQFHVMKYFIKHGINFYAIDLRKCGRSLLNNQSANYCKNLREYFPDIDYGINLILEQFPETKLFVLGHSTGGLLATYYAKFGLHRPKIAGLILNSPFFEFNLPFYIKPFIESMARKRFSKDPFGYMQGLPSLYGESLHKQYNGEWSYNLQYKPIIPFGNYYAWILAVLKAQYVIQEKPDLGSLPILILHSSQSGNPRKLTKETSSSDVVLQVKDMIKIGAKLGENVSFFSVDQGLHDVFLSQKFARDKALAKCVEFIYNSQK
ncbi:alpha/beta hydrolase [Myroides sp. LJL119]